MRVMRRSPLETVELTAVNEPVILGANADDAFAYVRRKGMALALLDGLEEVALARTLGELATMLGARATPEGVHLSGGAWLITAQLA
jgi:hypothetical protein